MQKFIFSLSLSFLFAIITVAVKAQPEPTLKGIQALRNIAYKTTGNDTSINLDIFLPDSIFLKKHPVVIIIHGGGWAEGDKTLETIYYMQRLRSELLKSRYAVISIDYSLVGKNIHFPTPIEDCKDAIRWVRAHSEKYDLDTSNIGLWGGSAGGHLALLTAYTTDDQFAGDKGLSAYSARVNYVIDNFGPTDLNALFKMDIGWVPTFIFKIFFHKLYQLREKLVFAMTVIKLKQIKKK